MHHPRRVERMKAFSPMLQDQDFRLIVDDGNRGTIAVAMRAEAAETTVSVHLAHRALGNS
jgi:hypothetical protein